MKKGGRDGDGAGGREERKRVSVIEEGSDGGRE